MLVCCSDEDDDEVLTPSDCSKALNVLPKVVVLRLVFVPFFVWITFCDAMQKDKINTNIDVCVFDLKRE